MDVTYIATTGSTKRHIHAGGNATEDYQAMCKAKGDFAIVPAEHPDFTEVCSNCTKRHAKAQATAQDEAAEGRSKTLAEEAAEALAAEDAQAATEQPEQEQEPEAKPAKKTKAPKPAKAKASKGKAAKVKAPSGEGLVEIKIGHRILEFVKTNLDDKHPDLVKLIDAAPRARKGNGAVVTLAAPYEDIMAVRTMLNAMAEDFEAGKLKPAQTGFRQDNVAFAVRKIDAALRAA